MNKKIYIIFVPILLLTLSLKAQNYPFELPENFTATLNVSTTDKEPFNNLLLGTNIQKIREEYGQELIRDFDPITIRFPHGLLANWYDWERDTYRVYGTETFQFTRPDGSIGTKEISYLSSIKATGQYDNRVGIGQLNVLNNEKKASTGKGYDMIWTFNMSADGTDFNNGSPVSVARYKDMIRRGFEVKAIEMGNENFYAGQRSSIIPNPQDYIARAKSMYAALKALDPNLKLSVNMERKGIPANEWWNTLLTKDGTDYFDAVTVHTYIGYDPDEPANGDDAYGTALTAREVLRKTIDDYCAVVAPDKPVWLTEWGVKSGGPNAVSALGMADCYIFMSENQQRYERANWFTVNGVLNSFLVWENDEIKYPLRKTVYGSTFGIIRSVFENSTLLGSEITVPTLDGVVNAVSARVVKKDNKTIVFVVNLSNQEVPFSILLDGKPYQGEFEHKSLAFSTMSEEPSLPFHDDPLSLVKKGKGSIHLPKFSINTIFLKDTILIPQSEVDTCYKVSFNTGDEIIDILTKGFPALLPNLPEEPLQTDSVFNYWITAEGKRFDTTYLVFQDMEVFPTWQVKRFPLNVVSPNGGIIYEPQKATYEIHTKVKLTAKPNSNYEFVNWTGNIQSNDTTITVMMDSTINLVANYRQLPYYRLDVYFSKGEVNKFPNSSRYISGFTVKLTPTPTSGYQFASWSGDYVGTENPLYLTMRKDMEIYANFVPKTTAIESVNKSIVKVFPNPNNGVFTIQSDDFLSADYTLHNIAGVKIQDGIVYSNQKIKVINNKPGVYILKVQNGKEQKVFKLIIQQ